MNEIKIDTFAQIKKASMDLVINNFIEQFINATKENTFIKLTLGKKRGKSRDLKNIYVRIVEIKEQEMLSFTYRYENRDEVKNYAFEEAKPIIEKYLGTELMKAHLFTIDTDYTLSINKKGKGHLIKSDATLKKTDDKQHDHQKKRYTDVSSSYLHKLGITDEKGVVRPKKTDKFKQINKYIELLNPIMDSKTWDKKIRIVDMGAGKAYLTFALYDYLERETDYKVEMIGVEQRSELVDASNQLANDCGFENLKFETGTIEDFKYSEVDVLIALHACDTATDDAIFQGIKSGASIIVCAPCCHKQIRNQIQADPEVLPQLKYGILMERQAEMLTDTIRALIMEQKGYESKIFEFVSGEHTPKNLMIVGVKTGNKIDVEAIQQKIDGMKAQYKIEYHYLEKLFSKK